VPTPDIYSRLSKKIGPYNRLFWVLIIGALVTLSVLILVLRNNPLLSPDLIKVIPVVSAFVFLILVTSIWALQVKSFEPASSSLLTWWQVFKLNILFVGLFIVMLMFVDLIGALYA